MHTAAGRRAEGIFVGVDDNGAGGGDAAPGRATRRSDAQTAEGDGASATAARSSGVGLPVPMSIPL